MHYVQPTTTCGQPVPSWYQTYFAAVVESDEAKALTQIEQAGRAIEDRLIQLRCASPGNSQEIQDLNCALTYLRLLLWNSDAESEVVSWE